MADFTESGTWSGVQKLETTTAVLGGDEDAPSNLPLKQLVNRDNWIKTLVNQIIAGNTGILGTLLNGSTVANVFTTQENDTAVASTSFVQSQLAIHRKNVILNGDFRVAQRGAAFHIASGSSIFTLDRWLVECGGTTKAGDLTQNVGILRSAFMETYAALVGSFTDTGSLKIKQRIPGVLQFEGGKCTLSFYFNSDHDFTMPVTFSQFLKSSEISGTAHWSDTQNVSVVHGMNKYTVVFTVAGLTTIDDTDLDGDNCIEICFDIDTDDIDFWMTQIQLEAGQLATNFEQRDDTLACLYFYEAKKIHEKWGQVGTESGHNHWGNLYTSRKRIAPRTTTDTIAYTHLTNFEVKTTDESSIYWQVDEPALAVEGYLTCEFSGTVYIDAEIQ